MVVGDPCAQNEVSPLLVVQFTGVVHRNLIGVTPRLLFGGGGPKYRIGDVAAIELIGRAHYSAHVFAIVHEQGEVTCRIGCCSIGTAVGVVDCVAGSFPVEQLTRIHPVGERVDRVECDRAVVVDRHCSLLALLGGDEHNSVGSSRTVDRCCRGVLEYLDRLDVTRVQVGHAAAHQRYAVHDVQRIVGGAHRTGTANAHLAQLARTVVAGDIYPRGLTLYRLKNVLHGSLSDVLLAHTREGARHVAALGRTVADHHDLVEHAIVLGHDNVDGGAVVYRHRLRLVADQLHCQAGAAVHSLQCVATFTVGNSAARGLHDGDSDTGKGEAVLVTYRTAYRLGLAPGDGSRRQNEQAGNEQPGQERRNTGPRPLFRRSFPEK